MTQQTDPELAVQSEVVADQPVDQEPEEVDWQVRAEAAEAANKKLENELKSQQGRNRRTDDVQHQLSSIGDRLSTIESANQAVLRAFSSGDTDDLPNELSTIQAQARQTSANRSYEARYADLSEELREAVQDDEGNPILDLYEAPELESIRQEWVTAHRNKDTGALATALAKAHRVARSVERTTGRSSEQQIRTEEREAAKARLEEAGIFDLDTGPSAAGGGRSDDRWFREVYGSQTYDPTPADHKRARDYLQRLSG